MPGTGKESTSPGPASVNRAGWLVPIEAEVRFGGYRWRRSRAQQTGSESLVDPLPSEERGV
jgi:hypothetical protein